MKVNPIPMRILKENSKPLVVFQGASSSGKTYSILQFIILQCYSGEWKDKTIDILRRTTPALKRSVMKDFFDILTSLGVYRIKNHNKTDSTYILKNNLIRFYSADEEQKLRGLRRDVLYLNEVLEFKRMDVMQVLMRTNELSLMDYNPSETFHWVYDEVLTRNDVTFHKSTYKENEFINEKVKQELEGLKERDKQLYHIYSLGERGVSREIIFTNWEYADKDFEDYEGQLLFGMDFGYNDPTALIRLKYHKKGIIIDELLYKSELTSDQILEELNKLKKENLISFNDEIIGDSARPEIIKEVYRGGYNVHSAKKGKGSVLKDINFIKMHKLYITKRSTNLIKELKSYKWKIDKNDKALDEPVDFRNHLIDALRYALEPKANESEFAVGSVNWL